MPNFSARPPSGFTATLKFQLAATVQIIRKKSVLKQEEQLIIFSKLRVEKIIFRKSKKMTLANVLCVC